MGHHAGAKIAYGYDLGGVDGEWNIRETDEYGEITLDWYDEHEDFHTQLQEILTEHADDLPGVRLIMYGHEYNGTFLTATDTIEHDASGGWVETFDDAVLIGVRMIADAKLKRAIEVMGIHPEGPCGWHLLLSYG